MKYDYQVRTQYKVSTSHCHCGLDPQSPGTSIFDEIAGQARNDNVLVVP